VGLTARETFKEKKETTDKQKERQKERKIDKQNLTDRQTERHTVRKAFKKTDGRRVVKTENRHTERKARR
jgi:hypothetical protein